MPWMQLKIDTSNNLAEPISEALEELEALAVTLEDRADQPIFEPELGTTPLWKEVCVVGLFDIDIAVDPLINQLEKRFGALRWNSERLEDRDWVRECMESFEPIQFGQHLWIVPSWHSAPDKKGINLHLDPGLAFGTGTHPTTALCLEWLDANPPKNSSIIDYGCGSGILGIAALKLGGRHCTGIDTDPQALEASQSNAEKNSVSNQLKLNLPNQVEIEAADLLLANILANPLIDLAHKLAGLTKQGGVIVLSGILAEQAQRVSDAYTPYFEMAKPVQQEDWIRLEGIRK
ncbi:MAG: 50S ribosomal protein L11 methyltransferase [Gammaproteobacteria bacterium]|nr:50S ribosomal protein L11 methyltransferase [Gammaproteobacteria bacterium]MCF6230981.1 50S ribosomal protein L11 methyltransferase [Gammaproteobacteria bacterium]